MSGDFSQLDDGTDGSFWKRYCVTIVLAAVLALGAGAWWFFVPKADKSKKSVVTMVAIAPLPPPPQSTPVPTPAPTPPPVEQPEERQEAKQDFVEESVNEPEAAQDDTPQIGSNIQGEGGNDFGLRGKGSAALPSAFGGSRGGGGSKYGAYAGMVQSRVGEALRNNARTRRVNGEFRVRIWVDASGRITRARLQGSTGSAEADRAINEDALVGVFLPQPPPADMPMPILMQVRARQQ